MLENRESSPQGIAFNNDGTKMFVIGSSGDEVNEYSLSTAFDVSSASYSQSFFSEFSRYKSLGMTFNNDGTKMYVVGNTGNDINEYSLTTAFDVSTTACFNQLFQ